MIEETLMQLHKQINRIEEKDPEYRLNPKWIELRKQQDLAYRELAERKLKYHTRQFNEYGNEVNGKFMRIYQEYLEGQDEKCN